MILIIDNGSQYTHLIKRNCRDLGVETELINSRVQMPDLIKYSKIILSGGPSSVYTDPPNLSSEICKKIKNNELNIPVFGICYGQQMIAHIFGARVDKGKSAEYGITEITVEKNSKILNGINGKFKAWVSHFDEVKEVPKGFKKIAHSDSCNIEAIEHETRPICSVQFHPEVWHTENGEKIISNFLKLF